MNRFKKFALVTAGLALLPVSGSLAQEGASSIEEVVVTARKRAESLQEVPIAITAFTEQTIERAGIERPADFISLMPNVTIVDTANVGDTQVSIRGIVSTRDAESTFAYVVDGILSTNPNSFNEELVNVRQIEVLKGPQGALYGRNAVAGAILVTTKEPGEEFEGTAKIGAGSDNLVNASLRLSGPVGNARGSLAASYRDHDGVYSNIYENAPSGVDYLEDTTLRGRLMWETGDSLSWDLRGGYSDVSGGAINFNAAFAVPAFNSLPGAAKYVENVNDHDFIFAFNVPGENEQETTEFALKADYTTDAGDWTFVASFNDLDEYLLSDGVSASFYGYELTPACQADRELLNSFVRPDLFGPPLQPFLVLPPPSAGGADFQGIYGPYTPTACDGFQYQERNQQDSSVEIRFTSPQDQSIRWIAGVYAAEIDREVVVAYGADTGAGFLRQPYVVPTGPNPTDQLFWDDFDTSVIAAFGEVSFDIGETSELSLALRWDEEDRKVTNRVPNVNASGLSINATGPINPGLVSNPSGIPTRSETFSQVQPKVSWRWAATERINVYASWGVGFRSGGFNSLGSEDLLNFWFNQGFGGAGEVVQAGLTVTDEYDKEVSTSYELGIKTTSADNRFQLNAAMFNTDVEDNQFFEFFAGPFGILRVVTGIDELTVQGFEADFNWMVSDNLSLFGGVGILDSEIDKNTNRPLSVGNDVPQAPDETYNLGVQLDFPIGNAFNLFARADWQHVGEMYFHTIQDESTPTIWQAFPNLDFLGDRSNDFSLATRDAYDTVNLRLGLEGNGWSVTAWGRNITDEEYLEEIIPAIEFGGSFIHPAAKATYGVEFGYEF
jgi:iron complex outermembrane receptor protein